VSASDPFPPKVGHSRSPKSGWGRQFRTPSAPAGGLSHEGRSDTICSERRGPDPDPIDELVPGGAGSLPATKLSATEETELLAFTDTQKPNLLDELAAVDGTGTLDPRAQPGFGPTELDGPQFEGNPEIGIDPNLVRNNMPPKDN
jgi:hypothetical protein